MKKNYLKYLYVLFSLCILVGCGAKPDANSGEVTEQVEVTEQAEVTEQVEVAIEAEDEKIQEKPALDDGTYIAEFNTDSSMFHVNEANNGKGILTVEDGKMMLHISLPSKNVLNLYPGLAEDASKDGAELLEPTIDTVTYSDGMTEEVHGFDIPVPAIDDEFDLALIGTKGKWYDHKVSVTNPVPGENINSEAENSETVSEDIALADGEYMVDITMEGGTGKAKIESPAKMVMKDNIATVTITWSSPNYDYMLLDGVKYEPVNTEGNSVFELPIGSFDTPITVIGDTTAMSKPHEVEYTIICSVK